MSGNMWIHVAILLTMFAGLAERQRLEAEDSPSIGHLGTSGGVERELEIHGTITEGSESTPRPDDQQKKGDFGMAAEND